jgi:hypothetical protein
MLSLIFYKGKVSAIGRESSFKGGLSSAGDIHKLQAVALVKGSAITGT